MLPYKIVKFNLQMKSEAKMGKREKTKKKLMVKKSGNLGVKEGKIKHIFLIQEKRGKRGKLEEEHRIFNLDLQKPSSVRKSVED